MAVYFTERHVHSKQRERALAKEAELQKEVNIAQNSMRRLGTFATVLMVSAAVLLLNDLFWWLLLPAAFGLVVAVALRQTVRRLKLVQNQLDRLRSNPTNSVLSVPLFQTGCADGRDRFTQQDGFPPHLRKKNEVVKYLLLVAKLREKAARLSPELEQEVIDFYFDTEEAAAKLLDKLLEHLRDNQALDELKDEVPEQDRAEAQEKLDGLQQAATTAIEQLLVNQLTRLEQLRLDIEEAETIQREAAEEQRAAARAERVKKLMRKIGETAFRGETTPPSP